VDACSCWKQILALVGTEVGLADERDPREWLVEPAVDLPEVVDKLLSLLFDWGGDEDILEAVDLPQQRRRRGQGSHGFARSTWSLHCEIAAVAEGVDRRLDGVGLILVGGLEPKIRLPVRRLCHMSRSTPIALISSLGG
jgi:hypothetical protein